MKINIPETKQERVVVVGGGFAGLTLVKKLAKSNYQVVLLDKNNYHQFQPLFYQVAMSGLEPSSIIFPFRKLFSRNKNVFIRIADVSSVNTKEKFLETNKGRCNYDHLVIATGAETNFFGNKDLEMLTIPMKSVSEALFLRNKILADYEQALTEPDYDKRQGFVDIVIVGGGPTGVEVAGALAEMKRYIIPKDYPELNAKEIDIHLIQGGPVLLQGMSEKASKKAYDFLVKMGVKVKLSTRVTSYDGEYVYMGDDTKIQSKKVIWAAGITGCMLEGLPEEAKMRGNRIMVDAQHRIEGFSDIYAIGDIAYMMEEEYPNGHPQVAQVAMQQAKNLARNLKSKKEKSFKYKDLGSMATIGRHKAVADLPGFRFAGLFAWFVWLFVHLFQIIGTKNKLFVFLNWVWGYFTYDQSLRLIIRPYVPDKEKEYTVK